MLNDKGFNDFLVNDMMQRAANTVEAIRGKPDAVDHKFDLGKLTVKNMREKLSETKKDLLDPMAMNFIIKTLIESSDFKLKSNPTQSSGIYNLMQCFIILFSGDNVSDISLKLIKTCGKFIKCLLNELDTLTDEHEMLDAIVNSKLF